LILVLIGLIVTPLRLSYMLLNTHVPLVTGDAWLALTSPGSEAYHPLWAPLLLFEIVTNIGFILSSLALLFLMFQKSPIFPRLAIVYFIANALFVTGDQLLASLIPAVAAQHDPGSDREMSRSIASACVWVPYLVRSRRVQSTFRRKPTGSTLPASP
jgi:hypothetical protein